MAFSQKRKRKFELDGYVYNHNKTWTCAEGDRHLWCCEERVHGHSTGSCRATVTTDSDGNIIRQSVANHTHVRSENRSAVLTTMHRIRTDAMQTVDETPAAIMNRRVPARLAGNLPCVRNIAQAVRHMRNKRFPAEPQSASDVALQQQWAETISGDEWTFPVVSNGQHAIMFTTEQNLQILHVSLSMEDTSEIV